MPLLNVGALNLKTMLQPIIYKQAVINALEAKNLATLKELYSLRNKKQIFLVNTINEVRGLAPDNETGFLFGANIKNYLVEP